MMQVYRCVAFVVLTLAVLASSTAAEEDISVSPSRTRMSLAPGETGNQTITVTNNTENEVPCLFQKAAWAITPSELRSDASDPAGTQVHWCTDWTTVSPNPFTLDPRESRDISISVSLPDTARGSSCCLLLLEASPTVFIPPDSTPVAIPISINHPVIVDTEERTTWAASVDTFYISRPDDNKPLVITLVLRNEGNGIIVPEGSFKIVDDMETVWGKVDIGDYVGFCGTRIRISEQWKGILLVQPYELIGTIDIGGGQVLTPKLTFRVTNWMRIAGITVSREGESLVAIVDIMNGGNITSTVDVLLEIRNHKGYRVGKIDGGETTVLPDETNELAFALPELESGEYELTASISSPENQTDASIHFEVP
jgi:hypothetical protein